MGDGVIWAGEGSVEVVRKDFHSGWIKEMAGEVVLGPFIRPSSGISPCLWPRRLIHTDCITSGLPLGLAQEQLLQKIRRQDEPEVRGLSSQHPPFLPCHRGLTVTVYLRLQLSPTAALSGFQETFPCPPSFLHI